MTKSTQITDESLIKIVESARIAPSSHNTQPWLFSIEKNKVLFFVDPSRHLKVADPTDRELYASIGCAIANAIVESVALGYGYDLELFPQKHDNTCVAHLNLSKDISNTQHHYAQLQPYIVNRLSNRFKYKKNKKIPKLFIDQAKALAQDFQVQLNFFDDENTKGLLADLTRQAIFKAISSPEFRNELTHWVRHNWTKKTDGMPGYASGMPGVVSLLFPALIHSPSMPKMVSESEHQMVTESSGVVVLSTQKDTVTDWVNAGIALELIWLLATKSRLGMSLLSGAVEYELERQQVQKLLKGATVPNVFFRIGFPTQVSRPSPRRTLEDVLQPYQLTKNN